MLTEELYLLQNQIKTHLKLLQQYTPEDLKNITKQKTKLIYYNNTIQEDINVMKLLLLSPDIVLKLYNQGVISFLGAWWYLQDHNPEGRIQTKLVNKLNYFMSYFTTVQDDLNTISKKELYA